MKKPEHIKEAKEIGDGHYMLMTYDQLPKNASAERQVVALLEDRKWQENHQLEMSNAIDRLIQKIDGTCPEGVE